MPKEILNIIILQHMVVVFLAILVVYTAANFINLKLGLHLLGASPNPKKIWLGVIILNIYCVTGKQVLPDFAYGLTLLIIFVIILHEIANVSLIKCIWSAVILIVASSIGMVCVLEPISLNRDIYSFLCETPLGVVFGTIIELLGSLAVWIVLSIFHISMVPPFKKKVTFLDCLKVFFCTTMVILTYLMFALIVPILKDGIKQSTILTLSCQWAVVIAAVISFCFIIVLTQKASDDDQHRHAEEVNRLQNMVDNSIKGSHKAVVDEIASTNKAIAEDIVNKIQSTDCAIRQSEGGIMIETYLTAQELKLIECVVQGMSDDEIADEMNFVPGTVRNQISKILGKLGLSSREQMVIYAMKKELFNKKDKKD